jgi:ABC-type uncharacterized transport system ATPase subunit
MKLKKDQKKFYAIKDLNFSVDNRECFGLLGTDFYKIIGFIKILSQLFFRYQWCW